jgi:hypothetical protein
MQMDKKDLTPSSAVRIQKYRDESVLPMSVLRTNASIDPGAQIQLAEELLLAPRPWSKRLSWNGFPTFEQLEGVCDLIWRFLVRERRKGGVSSAKQLAFKLSQLRQVPDSAERVRQELRPSDYGAKTPDEAVERVLEFERTWASFEFPRSLMAVSRIQRAVFEPRGLPFGDYSFYASQVECVFQSPVLATLDEYGIPLQMGIRISGRLKETVDLDSALVKLRDLKLSGLGLSDFEKEILSFAQAAL